MSPGTERRAVIFQKIETSRQLAERLEVLSKSPNVDVDDSARQASLELLSAVVTRNDGMLESRLRTLACEAIAWLEAIAERRETSGRPDTDGPDLRVVA